MTKFKIKIRNLESVAAHFRGSRRGRKLRNRRIRRQTKLENSRYRDIDL